MARGVGKAQINKKYSSDNYCGLVIGKKGDFPKSFNKDVQVFEDIDKIIYQIRRVLIGEKGN